MKAFDPAEAEPRSNVRAQTEAKARAASMSAEIWDHRLCAVAARITDRTSSMAIADAGPDWAIHFAAATLARDGDEITGAPNSDGSMFSSAPLMPLVAIRANGEPGWSRVTLSGDAYARSGALRDPLRQQRREAKRDARRSPKRQIAMCFGNIRRTIFFRAAE